MTSRRQALSALGLSKTAETVVGSERPQALEGITPGRTVALPLSDAEAAARAAAAARG